MSNVRWKNGYRGNIAADIAAEEFARISDGEGGLTPAAIVEAARPKDAPLHPAFEWNNAKAAELYRRNQASTMVRALVVLRGDEGCPEHRAFVRVSSEQGGNAVPLSGMAPTHYVPMTVAVQDARMFADALGRFEAKVADAQRSARELQALANAEGAEPERLARIGLAVRALETASVAISELH
jgi:hypothetical protein